MPLPPFLQRLTHTKTDMDHFKLQAASENKKAVNDLLRVHGFAFSNLQSQGGFSKIKCLLDKDMGII